MFDLFPNIPLADKTTYRIGGCARWYVEPIVANDIAAAVTRARDETLPILILGKGSNILISDRGWPGLVINLSAAMTRIEWHGDSVTAQAGALLDAGYGGRRRGDECRRFFDQHRRYAPRSRVS
jgi:UDP-N-acetylmuramate dehydrogenase